MGGAVPGCPHRPPGGELVALDSVFTSPAEEIATTTGLLALSALLLALVMPARLRSLVATLGIEKILRGHRLLALTALGLVLAHVVLELLTDPRGLTILDLRDTTPAAWAGTLSTLALVLGVEPSACAGASAARATRAGGSCTSPWRRSS